MSDDLSDFGWLDEGQGPPILLLHSSAASKRQWNRLRAPWAGRYRTLALDLWGYGETPFPPDPARFDIGQEVQLARRLLSRADRPVDVIGHSYGGVVALELALREPSLVRQVIVHEPVLFHLLRASGFESELKAITALARRTESEIAANRPDCAAALFVDYWNGEGAWSRIPPDKQARAAAMAAKAPLDFRALFALDTPPEGYAALVDRAFVTVGEHTRSPARCVAEILGELWGAEKLQVVPKAGHMAPMTAPEALRPLIEPMLSA